MTDSHGNFGEMIESTLNFGREDRSSKYKKIDPSVCKYEDFTHACHVMIYAKTNSSALGMYEQKAIALMQMRFDGYIGFPGGIVHKGETPLEALCREVKEEVGWSEEDKPITDADYQFTHVDVDKKLVLHFYATEVTEAALKRIENNVTKAHDYGTEVLGMFRVPLYIMGDAFRGFPAFLRNHFVGNSKLQLLHTLINLKFFTEEQIIQALHSPPLLTF